MSCFVRVIAMTIGMLALTTAHARAQPGQTPPSPAAPADVDQRAPGVTLGIALGGGSSGVMFGAEVGVLVRPDLAIIGTATALVRSEDDGGTFGFLGAGARYWIDHVFFDAQLGRITVSTSCDLEERCTSDHIFAGEVGAGFELAQTRHFGLDFHGAVLIAHQAHDTGTTTFAGMGIHVYF